MNMTVKKCKVGEGHSTRYLIPPEGWKIQDNDPEFISMLRVVKGDWSIDWKSDKDDLKDYYMSAEHFDGLYDWEVTLYDPYEGHSGLRVRGRDNAVREMVAQARATEAYESVLAKGGTKEAAIEALQNTLDKHHARYGYQVK